MSKESKLELLDQLEEKVELLHAQTKETRKCLEAATERISSDGVLEVTRIDSIRKLLSEVKALTLTSSSLLSELGSDAVPASFSEFSEEIEGLRRLLDKSVYIEAREFLLGFGSTTRTSRNCLRRSKRTCFLWISKACLLVTARRSSVIMSC